MTVLNGKTTNVEDTIPAFIQAVFGTVNEQVELSA